MLTDKNPTPYSPLPKYILRRRKWKITIVQRVGNYTARKNTECQAQFAV
jgi:hypothetical protein